MRIYNRLPLFAAVLLLLLSCNKQALQGDGTGLRMQFNASLAGDTKGSLTTADLTDFYLQVSATDPAYSYFEHASKDGSGAWTTPSRLYWIDEEASVSYAAARFGAYAFTADEFKNGADLVLPKDQSTQERLNAADLLTMPAASKKFTDTAGGTLPVALSHGLAKVTVTLTLGPKFYDNNYTRAENPVKDFTVSGTNLAFTFQPQTGAVSATADTKADILALAGAFTPGTAESKSATATYEAILVPQTLAAGALKVTFKVGDYGYEWSNAAAITLETGKTSDLAVSVTTAPPVDPYNGHAYVNMGNGLKWATCNVGAENPEDYGDYFDWGATVPYYQAGHSQDNPCADWIDGKDGYNWENYSFMENGQSSWKRITKYTFADNQKDGTNWYDGDTFIGDGKTSFANDDYADDAARANWGGNWRTPTDAEWTWLRDENNCDWLWTTQNGVNGMLVTSKINGNKIFLPAAGYRSSASLYDAGSYGYFWSSSLDESFSDYARRVYFYSGGVYRNFDSRFSGQSVRPVTD